MTTGVERFTIKGFDDLIAQAAANPRRRQHRNVHATFADPCQRFFNAIWRDSYIPPHRHSASSGNETLVVIRGSAAVLFFDEAGEIMDAVRIGDDEDSVGVDIPPSQWHSVVALSDVVVLIEIKAGPFDADQPKEFAPWAPAERSKGAAAYLVQMQRAASAQQAQITA